MSVNVTLLLVMAVLFAAGIYQLTERSLTRVLLGIVLMGNAVNLLILAMGGVGGAPPIVGDGEPSGQSDPLPQALILTAIVITFAVTAFMLGIIYRSWWLSRRDEIQVDAEDLRVAAETGFDPEDDKELPLETTEFVEGEK